LKVLMVIGFLLFMIGGGAMDSESILIPGVMLLGGLSMILFGYSKGGFNEHL